MVAVQIADCRKLLDPDSRFLFLTVYAVRMSAMALGALLQSHFGDLPGKVEFGELAVREEARGLLLPTAIFARWSNQGSNKGNI
jgi:23S rRNA (cytosine1962-C5)-methyltransferase